MTSYPYQQLKELLSDDDNNLEDRYPSISRNKIAWMAGGEIFFAEYKYLALINPRENAFLSKMEPPTFTWEGIGYDEFKVEFSPNEDFKGRGAFTLPLRRRSWLSGNPLTPNRREWRLIQRIAQRNGNIYWRVKGKDDEGNKALSEVKNFSIESAHNTVPRSRLYSRTRRTLR